MARGKPRLAAVAVLLLLSGLSATPSQAAPDAELRLWPVFANVVIEGRGSELPPTWRVESFFGATAEPAEDPLGLNGIVDVTAEWECGTTFQPRAVFIARCEPKEDPEPVQPTGQGEVTVYRDYACDAPAVYADVIGPAQNEYVTGTVRCEATSASCTASATVNNGSQWEGYCGVVTDPSPVPIECTVDLTGIFYDDWHVTCYATDP
jgi:hypothetical protein